MKMPKMTRNLLIIMVVVFLAQNVFTQRLAQFMLWPLGHFPMMVDNSGTVRDFGFMPWQLVTYGFMHDTKSLFHLLFNGIALYQFGSRLEYTWGAQKFLTFFLVCVIGAGLCQLAVVSYWYNPQIGPVPTLGASGGVYGILMAYGMLFTKERLMLMFPPIPMTARTLVLIFGAIELFLGVTGTQSGVAHFAHLGGMIFGWLLIRYWRGQPPFQKKRHLRGV